MFFICGCCCVALLYVWAHPHSRTSATHFNLQPWRTDPRGPRRAFPRATGQGGGIVESESSGPRPFFFTEASHWLDQMWRTGIPPLVSWQKIVFCPLSLIQPEVLQDTITRDRVKECLHHGRWVATPFISCVITAINVYSERVGNKR